MTDTVTITKPTGETLTLTGRDVNPCAAMGFNSWRANDQVSALVGWDQEIGGGYAIVDCVPTTQPEPSLFVRSHTLIATPWKRAADGVAWVQDDDRSVRLSVVVTTDYRRAA